MYKELNIYMVSIEWDCKNKINNFIQALSPLQANIIDNTYYYDSLIYTQFDKDNRFYQIAIESIEEPLLINNNNNNNNKLFKIVNTNLWIIKGEWLTGARGNQYHYCPSSNTAGTLLFKVGHIDIEIDIQVNIDGFDFDKLKLDFEGELWNLLTLSNSKVKAHHTVLLANKIFKHSESHLIISFINEFKKILNNPKRELKQTIAYLPFNKVKPIPITFRKIAISGSDGLLPSKAFTENYDTYENRYLCFMLYKIYQIVENNLSFSTRQIDRIKLEIDNIKDNINQLEKPQVINEAEVLEELRIQEKNLAQLEEKWQRISASISIIKDNDEDNDENFKYHTRIITINYKDTKSESGNTYWCTTEKIKLFKLTVPDEIVKYIEKYIEEKHSYLFEFAKIEPIEAHINHQTRSGISYLKFKILDIKKIEDTKVESEQKLLRKMQQRIELFKKNKLLKIIDTKEKQEQQNQISTLKKNILKIEDQITNLNNFSNELDDIKPELHYLLNLEFVKKINFKNLVRIQSSMTYIQNLNYKNALKFYQAILDAEGIDEDIFKVYDQIKQYYGVREMPQVFELWALVSIIKILETKFLYKHESSDLRKLLLSISPNNKTIDKYVKINFSGELNGRRVIVHYQKKLLNNKRPDFVLEIICNNRRTYIVLDAKFKKYNYAKTVINETQQMVEKYKINDKNYHVFILHPCTNISHLTPNNLGGSRMYLDNDNHILPFHQFGYLMMQPNKTNHLQKVIGMSLEYLIENTLFSNDKNPKPSCNMLCIACGGSELKMLPPFQYKSGGFQYTYSCQNSNCNHEINISYCWNCHAKIYKHGSYWDYHKTSSLSMFDVHCPNCYKTIADIR